MRTTIRIDEQLLSEAKQFALRSRKSLTSVIEDALREMLARQRGLAKRSAVRLTTVDGKGLVPGVDLDDSAGLLDLMDQHDASD
ncbi:MAG: type II toxin-antitoxin system VapB family antitoxin [Dehalococcoidia bacterium]